MIERPAASEKESKGADFELRKARPEDVEFLFRVSTEAMLPVTSALHPDRKVDGEEAFEEYKKKFKPDEIEVIQCAGQDVGRLRVVRSLESIYVGGIQILPEFQGRGIGTALFKALVEESKESKIPILLEVHDINARALSFYKKMGFVESGQTENKIVMRYEPAA